MTEIRCKKCSRLLMKASADMVVDDPCRPDGGTIDVEIMCPKCRYRITFLLVAKFQKK